jgi:hypothetical protein
MAQVPTQALLDALASAIDPSIRYLELHTGKPAGQKLGISWRDEAGREISVSGPLVPGWSLSIPRRAATGEIVVMPGD